MQLVSSSAAQQSLSRLTDRSNRLAQKLRKALNPFLVGMRDGLLLAARYNALSRLSNHALAKRGIRRADIGRAVLDDRNWPR